MANITYYREERLAATKGGNALSNNGPVFSMTRILRASLSCPCLLHPVPASVKYACLCNAGIYKGKIFLKTEGLCAPGPASLCAICNGPREK